MLHNLKALVLTGLVVSAAVLNPRQGWPRYRSQLDDRQGSYRDGSRPGLSGPLDAADLWSGQRTDDDRSSFSYDPSTITQTPMASSQIPTLTRWVQTSIRPTQQTTLTQSTQPFARPTQTSSSALPPSSTPSQPSDSVDYMTVVNKWRNNLSLSQLTQSSTLESNALKTVDDSRGQMIHQLNPGSFAQVLAPGNADNFENVFVGGWLCERPDLSGLNGICTTMSAGWAYNGQTGHADILVSPNYNNIGCALAYGIWACDLS